MKIEVMALPGEISVTSQNARGKLPPNKKKDFPRNYSGIVKRKRSQTLLERKSLLESFMEE